MYRGWITRNCLDKYLIYISKCGTPNKSWNTDECNFRIENWTIVNAMEARMQEAVAVVKKTHIITIMIYYSFTKSFLRIIATHCLEEVLLLYVIITVIKITFLSSLTSNATG